MTQPTDVPVKKASRISAADKSFVDFADDLTLAQIHYAVTCQVRPHHVGHVPVLSKHLSARDGSRSLIASTR